VLKRLLGRGRPRERRRLHARPPIAMAPIRPETPVWAVGDIHGRSDLALAILERILGREPAPEEPVRIVFLGDYVDRGEDARGVLELMADMAGWEEVAPVFLLGNHEAMLLGFLEDPEREARWLRVGGLQTCLSFGVGAYETVSPGELARIRDELAEAVAPHIGFLRALSPLHRSGNVLFVHAAADPALPPERQKTDVLLWGHPEFEREPRADGLWVVHGHHVVDLPRIERGRIAIDTGAYFSGCLTAALIAEGRVEFVPGAPGGGDRDGNGADAVAGPGGRGSATRTDWR
jgi:serine/threonine protein phosphatase 1